MSSGTGVVLFGLSVLTGPVLARGLGPSARGDLAAVLMSSIVLSWVLSCGIPIASAYFVDLVPERQLLATITCFGVAVTGPICAGLWFVLPAFLHGHSQTALLWARLALVAAPFSVGFQSALEIRRRQSAGAGWNRWRSAPLVLPAVGVIVLALIGHLTLQTALAAYFIGGSAPMLLLVSRLACSDGSSARPSWAVFKQLLPFAAQSAVVTAANAVSVRVDQVALTAMVPSRQLGLYAVAVTASSVSGPLTSGLSLALFGHHRDDHAGGRTSRRFRRTAALTFLLSCLTAGAVALAAPFVIPLAFGSAFQGAVTPVWILLPGQVATDVLGVLTTGLYAEGRPKEAMRAALLGGSITIAGLALLVPRFGISGAAWTTTLSFTAQVVFLVARGALSNASVRPSGKNAATVGMPIP
jgi:O-antigen/teichoic acid export membrane protein